jgi:hypothetical protein
MTIMVMTDRAFRRLTRRMLAVAQRFRPVCEERSRQLAQRAGEVSSSA